MIITCPACSTSYSVDPAAIGHEGKAVRCSNCANTWLQKPESAAIPPAGPQAAAPAPQPAPAPPPVPEPKPEPEPIPEPEPEPDPIPEPEPEPIPAPEPESGSSVETPESGTEGDGDDGGEAAGEEESGLSQDDLDAMFGMDSEPEAVESMVENADGDVPSTVEVPEDLPQPEPIPEVFSAPDMDDSEDGETGKAGKIVATLATVLIVGVVIGAFFARNQIVNVWPAAEGIYSAIGLSGRILGDGLDIRGVKSEREFEQGVELLVVRGIIANTIAESRPVPLIKVSLFDASNREIRQVTFPPQLETLPPGENITFKARLKEPPPTARRLEVTFTQPEDKPNG